MIVNDQRGPLFKELITYPDGTSFIPEGRNVLIPNAPRGAKVLKAALTKDLIPRYEKGIGFDTKSLAATGDGSMINRLVREISRLANTPIVVEFNVDGKTLSKQIANPMRAAINEIDSRKSIIATGRR